MNLKKLKESKDYVWFVGPNDADTDKKLSTKEICVRYDKKTKAVCCWKKGEGLKNYSSIEDREFIKWFGEQNKIEH